MIILETCKMLFDLFSKKKELEKENKIIISSILYDISGIILDTKKSFERNEYPHGNCVIMQNLSEKLCQKLSGFLDDFEIKKLSDYLIEASLLEKSFYENKDEAIICFEKASGEFKSLSILIKI